MPLIADGLLESGFGFPPAPVGQVGRAKVRQQPRVPGRDLEAALETAFRVLEALAPQVEDGELVVAEP